MENTQPTKNEQTISDKKVIENDIYSNCKQRFKKRCLLSFSASLCALIALILLTFVKSFKFAIDFGDKPLFFEESLSFEESLFFEIKSAINIIKAASSNPKILSVYVPFVSFTFVMSAATIILLICIIINLVKNIVYLANPKKYISMRSGKMEKASYESGKRKRSLQKTICSIFFALSILRFSVVIAKIIIEKAAMKGEASDFALYLYSFSIFNSVNANITFFVIFAVAFIVLHIATKIYSD